MPKADILRRSEERRCSIASPAATKQHRRHSQPELLVCRRRLTNSFFLKDRCSLSDQISFILASNWRAFILAMRDRDRANKNEIEIFVFSVTSNDVPHDMLLLILSLKIGAAVRVSAVVLDRTRYGLNRNGSTIDSRLATSQVKTPKLREGPDRGETRTGYQEALRQLRRQIL